MRHGQVIEEEQRGKEGVEKEEKSVSLHGAERAFEMHLTEFSKENVMTYVDCDSSRALCLLFIECKGVRTEVARRMGVSEGTIR
ncbi:MAG: hypothetical protein AAGD07_00515 [Planctomycetota bacterium]